MVLLHNTHDTIPTATLTGPLTEIDLMPPEWVSQGLCGQTDPEAFFPEKGGSTREAKKTCARCPVAAECLDYAIEHEERFGIWGGLSERERRKLMPAIKGQAPANGNTFKTHCVSGHEFTPENTYERPTGGRDCRKCLAEAQRRHRRTS